MHRPLRDRSAPARRSVRPAAVGLALLTAALLAAACETDPAPDAAGVGGAAAEPTTSTALAGDAGGSAGPDGGDAGATAPGGDDPTDPSTTGPTAPTDVVPGGTAVSLPGRSTPATSIRAIDFANLTYPMSVCGDVIDDPPKGGFPLTDGEVRADEDAQAGPYTVTLASERSFGDVNGDGTDDAALVLECSRGGQPVPMGWIYTLDDAGPRPLARVALDPDSLPLTGVLDTSLNRLGISGSLVTSTWEVYLDGTALCCPSKQAVVTWTWTDGGLTPGAPTITRFGSG